MHPTTYGYSFQGFHTVPRFGICCSDDVHLFTGMNWGFQQPKSLECQWLTGHSSRERTSGDASLKESQGSHMKLRVKIMTCGMVSIMIPILVIVNMQNFLCPSWSNESTMTFETQLPCILSISCNIQHLAQQHGDYKLQWSMLRNRTLCRFRWGNPANQQCIQHDHVIKWMKAKAAWKQKEFEPFGHCAASDAKRRLRQRKDWKCTF